MKTQIVEMKEMKLLPAAPGTCPECAVTHEPDQPHDKHSLFYQYKFYRDNGRWPTWKDAMAHCSEDMQRLWIDALKERGVKVE